MAHTLQHQILSRALDLISDQEHWTRGALARKNDDSACYWSDPYAYRFCAVGALARVTMDILGEGGSAWRLTKEAANKVLAINNRQFERLADINDREGHAVITEMFEKALAA